jgi:hypothetical protein
MSRSRLITVLALSALGAAAMVPAGHALAGNVTTVKSSVTITSGEGTEFKGTVTTGNKKCRGERKVKLFMESPSGEDEVVDIATTNSAGNWEMRGSFNAGTYHAQVSGRTIHSGTHTIKCLGDLSISSRF